MIITRAAIMYSNGEILEGKDYHSINSLAQKIGLYGDKIHGFVTSSGDFLLPSEASIIAVNEGQITSPVDELAPEDLWRVFQID